MFNNNLKQISLLCALIQAKAPVQKFIIGFKLITRSSLDEAYDIFWLLYESIHGNKAVFNKNIKVLITRANKGDDVRFDTQELCTTQPSEKLAIALKISVGGHLNQNRKGILSRPYMHHILMVWYLVALCGGDETQQIVALLHDYKEDVPDKAITVDTLSAVISFVFGGNVNQGCSALKNKTGISGKTPENLKLKHSWQLKHLSQILPSWQLIKLCDRLSNLYDCRRDGPVGNRPLTILNEIEKWHEFASVCSNSPALIDDAFDYINNLLYYKYDLKYFQSS